MFDVALSFPGEARPLVEKIAQELERRLGPNAYSYDNNYVSQLARPLSRYAPSRAFTAEPSSMWFSSARIIRRRIGAASNFARSKRSCSRGNTGGSCSFELTTARSMACSKPTAMSMPGILIQPGSPSLSARGLICCGGTHEIQSQKRSCSCGNGDRGPVGTWGGDFPGHIRSSSYITRFFEDCDLDFVHDGTTRWSWTACRLEELLNEPQPAPHALPHNFAKVIKTLLDKSDPEEGDPDRSKALVALNAVLIREGYEAFYDEHGAPHIRHAVTKTLSESANPHRPFTPAEVKRREQLVGYLDKCSEDELIEEVLLPLFRQLGFHRITAAGHKDKALEHGKDIWVRFTLPTQHVIYFGVQSKKDKLDAAGMRSTRQCQRCRDSQPGDHDAGP